MSLLSVIMMTKIMNTMKKMTVLQWCKRGLSHQYSVSVVGNDDDDNCNDDFYNIL